MRDKLHRRPHARARPHEYVRAQTPPHSRTHTAGRYNETGERKQGERGQSRNRKGGAPSARAFCSRQRWQRKYRDQYTSGKPLTRLPVFVSLHAHTLSCHFSPAAHLHLTQQMILRLLIWSLAPCCYLSLETKWPMSTDTQIKTPDGGQILEFQLPYDSTIGVYPSLLADARVYLTCPRLLKHFNCVPGPLHVPSDLWSFQIG